ncbi:zinc finger BED domain-containing protein DAYSLEEPER-like [Quillaja saponaria]|uniref:Zinc finger BED domain-containing protein DAYSLEEPER-like n=1 Tax=Quillaja saponaria TaxID=32244 RepID=A0AAD7PEG0_QUISA|nr:zinc finger BED domain-containing protein DAYSLEEPER-like [Quillaja saponaria]
MISAAVMEIDNNGEPCSEAQPNKRKRKKSIVWEHFTVKAAEPDCIRAYCNQCGKSFAYITGSKLAGTSHLKRHISLGICPVSRQNNQETPYLKTCGSGDASGPPKRRHGATPGFVRISFDQDNCNNDIARMIIQHEYPLHIVEHRGFNEFVRTVQPQFRTVSFDTIEENCVAMYLGLKQNLLNVISGIPGRVSLTLDIWTSNQTLGYVFLRGHFIDNDWNLHKPILNVVMVQSPDSDDSVNQSIVTCLSDWHLEGRIFTLAIDQSCFNETLMGSLRSFLSIKDPALLNGQLISGNCFARVLSHLAEDALYAMRDTIEKVRESVKYVKTSESLEEKFIELKQQLQVPSMKDLLIDDQNKWNTTYYMMVAACELKEVFACLDTSDPDYRITLSMGEWKQVETLCTYLRYLFDAANIVTAQSYPTANTFFSEVSKLHIELTHAAMSEDPFVSNLIKPLQEKLDKYWRESCLVLAVAVVLDPRFKMKLVEFTFAKIFGEKAEPWIRLVNDGLHELFLESLAQMLYLPAPNADEQDEDITKAEMSQEGSLEGAFLSVGDSLSDFEIYISDTNSSQQIESELDQYLEESLWPRLPDFDILNWWKLNRSKYPTLSSMASDILSIPISTLSADSLFDTEFRKMDSYRSSLRPSTLEALICAKDWFYGGSSPSPAPSDISNTIEKIEF